LHGFAKICKDLHGSARVCKDLQGPGRIREDFARMYMDLCGSIIICKLTDMRRLCPMKKDLHGFVKIL
jgi:hypothetical protein